MTGLQVLHLIVLGLWGGVILVEIIFETATLRGLFPAPEAAKLHRWTDRYVEIPLLLLVVATGLWQWARLGWSSQLLPKVGFGLAAVLANFVCVIFVEHRARERTYDFDARRIVASVVVGLPFALVALYLGGQRVGWW